MFIILTFLFAFIGIIVHFEKKYAIIVFNIKTKIVLLIGLIQRFSFKSSTYW